MTRKIENVATFELENIDWGTCGECGNHMNPNYEQNASADRPAGEIFLECSILDTQNCRSGWYTLSDYADNLS